MSYTNIYASGFKYAFDLDYEVQDITMKILVERGVYRICQEKN